MNRPSECLPDEDEMMDQENPWEALGKRSMDVLCALILLVLTAPLMGLAALLVRLTSRGSVIYSQVRLGRDDQPYTIYKIRTMYQDCERFSGPQWSRPGTGSDPGTPFLFIRGVRPNSPMTITIVESSNPRVSRSSMRLPTVASRIGKTLCIPLSRLE